MTLNQHKQWTHFNLIQYLPQTNCPKQNFLPNNGLIDLIFQTPQTFSSLSYRYPLKTPIKCHKNNNIQHFYIFTMYRIIIQFNIVATLVQFKRLANVYFLVTAVLQFIPAITPLSPFSAIAPLIFVLFVSLVRTAVEEIGKYRYDRQANSNTFLVYIEDQNTQQNSKSKHAQWKYKRSDELQVGNIVKILNNQRLPADIAILSTSNADGKAYIETSSLDGEKNLKIRNVLPSTQSIYADANNISKIEYNRPLITIEQANQHLYTFNGMIQYLRVLVKNNKSSISSYGKTKNVKFQQEKVSQFFKINQFLYRDSVLRNTQSIIGVIVYAGRYTKSMMNNTGGHNKMSQIEKKVNYYMVFIFILQFCLIVLCGLLRIQLFYKTQIGRTYTTIILSQTTRNYVVEGILTACTYFILLNTMIPISLLVTIEIVKYGQGFFISYDQFMAQKRIINSKEETIYAKAWRSSINEELGMVEYVFTDKTGTLTKNQMVLKKLIIGNKQYQNQNDNENKDNQKSEIKQLQKSRSKKSKSSEVKDFFMNYELQKQSYSSIQQVRSKFLKYLNSHIEDLESFQNSQSSITKLSNDLQDKNIVDNQKIMNSLMLVIMSTCHQCLLAKNENKSDEYHGSSPDEIALVDSANRVGYKFIQNCYNKIKLSIHQNPKNKAEPKNSLLQFTVQNIFQFNSDRKRMSIILSHPSIPEHKLLFCKGADNMIEKLLRPQYKQHHDNYKSKQYLHYEYVKENINMYSRIGLRTLLFGYKFIKNAEYEKIKQKIIKYSEINTNNNNKDKKGNTSESEKQLLINKLQTDLFLCGASGVEDKLQDQVQTVIEDLIKANIKVCMLTGDKMETAQNIAKSCRLFKEQWKIVKIEEGSQDWDIFRGYCSCKDYIESGQKYGILVEGSAIAAAVNSVYFVQMFQNCSAAVCCRITPKNKAQVVNFAKHQLKRMVLSIGDGANDVPMIQSANIGIGLYGNEGMNAVQASDFAIPQFKGLWRLLFVHGRWNYIRIAQLIKYFFYKNIVFTLAQLWFAYVCSFSGTSIYDATYLVLYNTIFTAGPVLVRALLEQDLNYVQIIKEVKMENTLHKNMSQNLKKSEELKQELLENSEKIIDQRAQVRKLTSLITINSIPAEELQKSELTSIRNFRKQHLLRTKDKNSDDDQSFNNNQKPKQVSKIKIDKNMKYLFPLLYKHSQQQLSFTPRIFALVIVESMVQSFCMFLTIYFGVNAQQLWIFSICLYTSVFALVTVRLCYDIAYWTWLMVFAVLFTSIIPYVLFIYVMSVFEPALNGTFIQLFKLSDFYLCNGLAIGVGAFLQGTFHVLYKYYFPTVVHFVRKQWKNMQKKEQQQLMRQKEQRKKERRKQIQQKYRQVMKSSKYPSFSKQSNMNFSVNKNNVTPLSKSVKYRGQAQIELQQYKNTRSKIAHTDSYKGI